MRVTFVLPAPIRVPVGGAAVVYRHAGGLAARGHDVTVVSPRRTLPGWRGVAMEVAVRVRDAVHGVSARPYYRAEGASSVVVPRIEGGWVPSGDAVIATGVQSVRDVAGLEVEHGRPFYFVQGDERFVSPSARETWRLPLRRITCAEWLAEEIRAAGEAVAAVVPNAVDPDDFAVDAPVGGRGPGVVALYHRHPVKGPDVLVDALAQIRAARPDAALAVFAARPPSHRLPDGVEVHVRPSPAALRALYNASSVFLHTSRSEAWSLATMEAAACGCAVVATASRGPREYLEPGRSMLEVPVGDGEGLARDALDLLADNDRRARLAEAAAADVARFSWDASTDRFERALLDGLSDGVGTP